MRNVLLVIADKASCPVLFEKTHRLLEGAGEVQLHVVQVIHEGVAELGTRAIEDSTRLKSFILEAAESALEDWVEPLRAQHPQLEMATLWNARAWEGVLHAAERAEADLIIKAAGVDHPLGDRVRTPDDWNVLRHAEVPVLLVKDYRWEDEPTLLCAVDAFDDDHEQLNVALLKQAAQLTESLRGTLRLVCAFPLFEPWIGELGAAASYADIRASIEGEVRERVEALATKAGISFEMLLLEEGHPAQVLARLAEEQEPALVMVGTHAREGIRGVLLGNTSERILHHVATDVVTVPSP